MHEEGTGEESLPTALAGIPERWKLPEEWWVGKPRLRQSPVGHQWCRPPGGARRPTRADRARRKSAGAEHRLMHDDEGRIPGEWRPQPVEIPTPEKSANPLPRGPVKAKERGIRIGAFNWQIGKEPRGDTREWVVEEGVVLTPRRGATTRRRSSREETTMP